MTALLHAAELKINERRTSGVPAEQDMHVLLVDELSLMDPIHVLKFDLFDDLMLAGDPRQGTSTDAYTYVLDLIKKAGGVVRQLEFNHRVKNSELFSMLNWLGYDGSYRSASTLPNP